MRKFAFGAAAAVLLAAPGAARAAVIGAEYSASAFVEATVSSVVFKTGGADATSVLSISVFDSGTSGDATTKGTGTLTGGLPSGTIDPTGPSFFVSSEVGGGADAPFGLSDSYLIGYLNLDFINTSPDAIEVTIDYDVSAAASSSIMDMPTTTEIAFSCASAYLDIDLGSEEISNGAESGDSSNCAAPAAPLMGALPTGTLSFDIAGDGVVFVDLFADSEGGALVQSVPVPAALPLLASGLGAFFWIGRRRRAA